MNIVTRTRLEEFWARHPDAEEPLTTWYNAALRARWRNMMEVRHRFPHADAVRVASGRSVTVFNMGGNKYRLVTAIHYNRRLIFVLRVLTHAEYSKGRWKEQL